MRALFVCLACASEARRVQRAVGTDPTANVDVVEASFKPMKTLSMALLAFNPAEAFTPVAPTFRNLGRHVQSTKSKLDLASGSVALSTKPAAIPHRSPEPSMNAEGEIVPPEGWVAVKEELWGPEKVPNIRIEGGQTLKTFKMPPHADRVQYILTSPSGRPIKAKVELWIGPIRCTHELIYDCMHGGTFPLKATFQFKKVEPVVKISTYGEYEFPLLAGIFVPSPEESEKIGKITEHMFYNPGFKEAVQGGSTIDNKGGAIRSFDIPTEWEKTQIMVWSKDVGKKSFKTNIEILQGPNNQKQHLNLRCGGSTQPYHAVIDTPGSGWTVRCNSKKFIEDGKFEIALAPYGPLAEPQNAVVMGGF